MASMNISVLSKFFENDIEVRFLVFFKILRLYMAKLIEKNTYHYKIEF